MRTIPARGSRSKARTFLLSLLPLLVFLVLAEVIVRLLRPDVALPGDKPQFRHDPLAKEETVTHVRDDRLGWRLKPSQRSGTILTNVHGFRGPEFKLEKPAGVCRIVFAGDSNVMGFGIAAAESMYSSLCERCLVATTTSSTRRLEVINMGVDAYSSHQVRLLLDAYLPQMIPDVVGIQVGFNDFLYAPISDRERKFARPALLEALEWSFAYRWFRRSLLRWMRWRSSDRRDYNPVPRVSPEEFESNLRDMVARCRDVGATPILMTTWPRPYIPMALNEMPVQEGGRTQWVGQQAWVYRRLAQAGVPMPPDRRHAQFLPVVEQACRDQPGWCVPQFLRSQGLAAAGRPEEAERAHAQALRLETERAILQGYMKRLRRVGVDEKVAVFDVESELAPHLTGRPLMAVTSLFTDFVHMGPEAQALVGERLCQSVAQILVERGGP